MMFIPQKIREKINQYAVAQHKLRRKKMRNKCRLIDAFMGKDFCALAWTYWVTNR